MSDDEHDQDVDLNIGNYTIDDLFLLFNLPQDSYSEFMIKDAANTLIARMQKEGRTELVAFLSGARDKLIKYVHDQEKEVPIQDIEAKDNVIDKVWEESFFDSLIENMPAGPETQKAVYFDDNVHFPIKNIGSKAGAGLTAKVVSTRLVVVDSQYRTNILPYSNDSSSTSFNTRFSFNLANPVNNAIGFRLYSYQIPTSYYAFTENNGNTFFQYNGVIIQIPAGNYTKTLMVTALNTIAQQNPATQGLVVTGPDPATGKITFTNNDPFSAEVTIIFYVQGNTANLSNCGQKLATLFQTVGINNTLGWALGFRTTPDPITGDVFITLATGQSVTANVPMDVYGPKYFMLNLEDFNNQRLTTGISNITHTKNLASLTVPDYYKTIHAECQFQSGNLTKAQQFSLNAVINNNTPVLAARYTNKINGPNFGSTFAIIPLANVEYLRVINAPVTQFGANLYMFERKYIKPVRIERLRVSLVDDKGNLVNLNDNDWSFTIIVDQFIA